MIVTNEAFDCGNLLADLSAHGLPADAKVIYRGRNVVAEVRGLCVKAFAVPGAVKGFIYAAMREPKARRAYENALRPIELGIATPRPCRVCDQHLESHAQRIVLCVRHARRL